MSDIHDLVAMDLCGFSLAIQAMPWNTFFYKTRHTLDDILDSSGYFNEAAENLRRNDRIEITANADGVAEAATLVVRSVTLVESRLWSQRWGAADGPPDQDPWRGRQDRSKSRAGSCCRCCGADAGRRREEAQAEEAKTFAHIRHYSEISR
ncbi:hypothetical protein [Bradyrhizobium cytisi]|uniref:Uncharacterized protein n=1 Tax=Bradyrhizobium cytisi TaxID=515489 RepID=A0A5S4WZJ5_9BRAD|nr:hypothetical protein [Bradyrhizobium cytisi]TYL87034.1 hypothetical protein FXB38_05330 [Bradyrhizobium cytisi]